MIKRIARVTVALILGVCLCALIATLFGADLTVTGGWGVPPVLRNILSIVTFMTTVLLWVGFVFDGQWNMVLKPFLCYFIVHVIACLTLYRFIGIELSGILISYIFPLCLIMYIGIRGKIIKRTIKRTLLWVAILAPFMLAVLFIKTNFVPNWVYMGDDKQGFFAVLEVIILSFVLYMTVGESAAFNFEPFIYRGRGNDKGTGAGSNDEGKLTVQRVVQSVATAVLILVQFAVALVVCKLGGVLIEGLIASVSFAIFGLFIRPRWHLRLRQKESESKKRHYFKNFLICTFASAGLFLVIGRTVPAFNYVLSASVLLGFAAAVFFNRLEYAHDEITVLREENNAFKSASPFKCKTATAEEIRERCLSLGKDDRYADFLVAVHRSGRRQKDIAEEFGITPETVKEYKRKRTREVDEV